MDEVFPPFVSVKPFATAGDRWSPLRCMEVIVYSTEAVLQKPSPVGEGGPLAVDEELVKD